MTNLLVYFVYLTDGNSSAGRNIFQIHITKSQYSPCTVVRLNLHELQDLVVIDAPSFWYLGVGELAFKIDEKSMQPIKPSYCVPLLKKRWLLRNKIMFNA